MRSGTRSVNRTDNLKFNAPRPKAQIDLAQSVHWFFNDYVDQWIGPKPYTFAVVAVVVVVGIGMLSVLGTVVKK
jgi:hypothetical protein